MPMFSQKMNLPIHHSNHILLHLNKEIKPKNVSILSLDVIRYILENHRYAHESFQFMLINDEIKSLSLLFNMQGFSPPPLGKDIS
jgi:hypothetical protein